MLAFQTKALGKPAEKAKEGICAVLCGEELSYMVDVYDMNSEAAKKLIEDITKFKTNFSGREAWERAIDYIAQLCGSSPVFVHGNERIHGDGFAAECAIRIISEYPNNFYSER